MGGIMSDFNLENKVVQSNDLVQLSKWDLEVIPMKIFKTLVSCIDTNHPKNSVSISRQELSQIVNSEDMRYIKRSLKSLQKHIIELKRADGGTTSLTMCPKIEYPPQYSDKNIEVIFAPELMPFLVNLKERFLQYDVANLKKFNSKYGLIIYEYLLSRERQERQSDHKYSINLNELRRLTDTQKNYKAQKDFKKRVIQTSVDDINHAGVEFLVRATDNGGRGRGGKATHVEFELRKRTSFKETVFDVVEHPEWLNQTTI